MATPKQPPIELEVTKVAFGGQGIASLSGKTCFVEGALPGEKIEALIVEEKKNYLRAKISKVLRSSPHRVQPPCPYYSHCGGCQYQHASYAEELRLKEAQVREIVARAGVQAVVKPIIHSEKDYGYRNGVTLHALPPKKNKAGSFGFIGRDNVSVIPVQNCILADDRLAPVFKAKPASKKLPKKAAFKLSEKGEIISDGQERFLRIRVGEASYLAHSQGFFQNNLAATRLLTDQVREWCSFLKPDIFFDLYAGVGTFSILCAEWARKIFCVEESAPSVLALRMNREERQLTQMEIVEAKAEKVFPDLFSKEKNTHTLVLVDPPRQGLDRALSKFLSERSDLEGLIYVSCDLSTLARDLKIILGSGYFQVKEVVPFDMFPRTKHIEVAVLLT